MVVWVLVGEQKFGGGSDLARLVSWPGASPPFGGRVKSGKPVAYRKLISDGATAVVRLRLQGYAPNPNRVLKRGA